MARQTYLHAVPGKGPAESPALEPKKVPASIVEALEGSTRDVLAAMRQELAKKLDRGEVSSNAIASAYKELRELDRLIRAEDAAEAQEAASRGNASQVRRSFNASAL